MIDLPRLVDSKEIFRGKIFYVALSYTKGRPLDFVVEDETNSGLFKIVTRDDGFEGKIDTYTGKKKAEELKIVTGIKLRPCVVIQKDDWNQNGGYPFVVILPIATLTDYHKTKPVYKRMIEYNDVESFHYLGNNCYITINDPQRVYKNMLFNIDSKFKFDQRNISMEEIMKKFAQCFEVKKIKECEECEHNCEICEYKLAVNK